MIRSDSEYRETLRRLDDLQRALREQEQYFISIGLSPAEAELAADPMLLQKLQIEHEVEVYSKLKRGDLEAIPPITDLRNIGVLLIAARIASGMTGRGLAEKLGIDESLVSRNERHEYHGISAERASQILDALDVGVSLVARRKLRNVGVPLDLESPSAWARTRDIEPEAEPVIHSGPLPSKVRNLALDFHAPNKCDEGPEDPKTPPKTPSLGMAA